MNLQNLAASIAQRFKFAFNPLHGSFHEVGLGALNRHIRPRTVGRHPHADIFLDDVTVSRKHAVFMSLADGGYGVRDSGSLNGTYVNHTRVEQVVLRAGDEVQIGKYRMTYHPGPALPAADL